MLAMRLNQEGFLVFAGCLQVDGHGAIQLTKECLHKERMTILQLDVTNQSEVDQSFEKVTSFIGNNDCGVKSLFAVINNAGIVDGALIEWSPSSSIADYERVMAVNFYGVVRVTRKFLPLIRKSKGRIVNLSSIMARTSLPGLSMYTVSKAATAKFSEGLMSEMGQLGVKIMEVNPWFYKTPMLSPQSILSNVQKAWNSADPEVRSSYGGQQFFDRHAEACVFTVTDPRNVSQNPEEVVDALHDAVTSYEPDTVYRVIPAKMEVAFWIVNDFLPWDLLIHVRRFVDKLPAYFPK